MGFLHPVWPYVRLLFLKHKSNTLNIKPSHVSAWPLKNEDTPKYVYNFPLPSKSLIRSHWATCTSPQAPGPCLNLHLCTCVPFCFCWSFLFLYWLFSFILQLKHHVLVKLPDLANKNTGHLLINIAQNMLILRNYSLLLGTSILSGKPVS